MTKSKPVKNAKSSKSKPAEIKQLKQQIQDLTDELKRARADFINFRRQAEEDKQRSIRFGRETAVMSLLSVVDNIERALMHVPKELEKNEWAMGVKAVARQVHEALKAIGVERMQSVGQEFDPNLHDAVGYEDNGGKGKKEVVVEELQPGYMMDGEVIRHAMVKVKRK